MRRSKKVGIGQLDNFQIAKKALICSVNVLLGGDIQDFGGKAEE